MAHSHLCHLFAGPPPSLPPPAAVRSVRGIVIPVDHPAPYYITIDLHGHPGPAGIMRWTPQLQNIHGAVNFPASAVSIKGAGDNLLRCPLQLHFEIPPDSMNNSTSQLNECVQALTGGTLRPWKGNIVVLKYNGSRRQAYTTAEDHDISRVVYFLLQYQ